MQGKFFFIDIIFENYKFLMTSIRVVFVKCMIILQRNIAIKNVYIKKHLHV